MKFRMLTVAALAAAAITANTSMTASAAFDFGTPTWDVSCDGIGYVTLHVEFTAGQDESMDISINGDLLNDSPYAPGNYDIEFKATDDTYNVQLEDHATGDVLEAEIFSVTCDGPIIEVNRECRTGTDLDGKYSVYPTIFDDSKNTYDVYVDGVLIDSDVAGFVEGHVIEGPLVLAGHEALVEVFLHGEDTEPLFSGTVSDDCGVSTEGSGAGLPGTGTNTTPLMLLATGLTLGGLVLLGARRTRRA